jgi:peptidoglycan/xylan/chitin deacetylase (PgdA/CDA1 family)
MTTSKGLAIVVALLAGGTSLALIGFLAAPQITARWTLAPESAPTAQRSTPADRLVSEIGQAGASGTVGSPVAPMQEAQPSPTTSTSAAQTGSTENSMVSSTSAIPPCDKPNGLGLSRIVQIDTAGGPRFGFIQHPEGYDFLRDKEVVLTFDDGPRPGSTEAVLKALTDECLRATFFEVGQMASWHPDVTKQLIDAGMTVGTHTWSHKDLARISPEKAQQQIEMANSAVSAAAGEKIGPFFRFPYLAQPPRILSYLAERNIAIFSGDIDSRDRGRRD